ncbi:hypothetical protein [Novosphingobium album (ex Liu et al. 2023)]|uniref:YcaO domain-containing protein n=1 Tax=Novosphingobium album (ex Liu et al. 2023) TaxID=3031130 RepID=A0ABT5WQA1_9SPHN|nr:hypothetical protein [Novosphingobium album (ex Liu et al. 2023)]MDE8652185.1 hypothetical protein [Novosphingobium album (ex Liu et al. 2023)]
MQAPIKIGALLSNDDWNALGEVIEAEDGGLLLSLFETFRAAGAKGFLFECAYIDRDFSAAYSAFYATLFHPYLKYCRRLHFFTEDLSYLGTIPTAEAVSREIGSKQSTYLGFIVLRPVTHAPVGSAVLASDRVTDASIQIDVRATHPVHLVGADLQVVGFPITQQDTRVGACAQAAIWMAGRHFHRDHGGPWFSLPDINDAALKPTDNFIARSLPAGSEFLTPDNIVRALRAMDRHPVFHLGRAAVDKPDQLRPLHEIIGRYLDSGIPVIIGLRGRDGATVGHAVVATGRVMREARDADLPDNPTSAEMISHFLVSDDQRGVDRRLPVRAADRSDEYPWTLEDDAVYAVTPLPAKVFMTGEAAETLSRDFIESCVARIDEYRQLARDRAGDASLGVANTVDPSFFAVPPSRLVARTYLTHGWRYKSRALRNRLPAAFKSELIGKQFPRYVWVTEFSLPDDLRGFDMCQRKVRAHVVVDATGSRFGESTLVVQIPGLSMFWTFDASVPVTSQRLVLRATEEADAYYPKVRGWFDYDHCAVPSS